MEGDQFFMSSFLYNLALRENDDPMGISDGGKPMGDHKDRSALHQTFQGLLNLCLRIGIKGGGGFIQYQDGCILQKGPGDGEALAFPTGKLDTLFSNDGLVPLGKPLDEIMGIGCLGCFDDLLIRAFQTSIGNIISNGIVEEDRLLSDQTDLIP